MSTLNQSRNGPATVQLREAHPGPAHARAGVSEPARESPHRIGPRRPLAVVAVDQARADAEGRVNEAEGRLAAAEAQLTQAQATHAQAKWDREAMARLFQKGLVAEQEAQRARNNAPGTRVVLLNVWGSWRELIVSPAERVIPVPADLSDEDAAQALVNPVTAWVMTMVEHDLKPVDWLVQTAASSTVGQHVLQLARSQRLRTVHILRRRARAPDIKALGGEVVISSEDND